MKAIKQRFDFEHGATRERACIRCRLSVECDGCCVWCIADGRNAPCFGQRCSLHGSDYMRRRFKTLVYIYHTFRPDLKLFLPRKYWKFIKTDDK